MLMVRETHPTIIDVFFYFLNGLKQVGCIPCTINDIVKLKMMIPGLMCWEYDMLMVRETHPTIIDVFFYLLNELT